jgi:hypothetical protein
MVDKSIDDYQNYVHMLKLVDDSSGSFGLNSKTVDAFCKSVQYGYREESGKYRYKCSILRSIGHVQYPILLSNCILYMNGDIGMDEFKRMFVWIGFSMKPEPVNLRKFVLQMNKIEELYKEIEEKQNKRTDNKTK